MTPRVTEYKYIFSFSILLAKLPPFFQGGIKNFTNLKYTYYDKSQVSKKVKGLDEKGDRLIPFKSGFLVLDHIVNLLLKFIIKQKLVDM